MERRMTTFPGLKILLASYGVPGIIAFEKLFAMGIVPSQISLLTHEFDDRNKSLREFTSALGIEAVDFSSDSDRAFDWVRGRDPDVLFSLHYRQRIPERILQLPSIGCVNLHPSLLPDYRGCFSVPWAIINGEEFTGFTYHYMVEEFDAGNIILQKNVAIELTDTAFSLFHKLVVEGMDSFESVFRKVVEERDPGTVQPVAGSYYSRKLPFDGKIDVSWSEEMIERFIRAMNFPPYKGAVVRVGDRESEFYSFDEYKREISSVGASFH
jgi:methionyl-tRNA formyltransferase